MIPSSAISPCPSSAPATTIKGLLTIAHRAATTGLPRQMVDMRAVYFSLLAILIFSMEIVKVTSIADHLFVV